MKILQVFHCDSAPDAFSMRVFPDSALLKGSKPVFLPCEEHDYRLSAGMALIIGKLGKGFAPRFADRYVEQIAPVAVIEDVTMTAELERRNACASLAWSFDGAVDIGGTLPPGMMTNDIVFRLAPLHPDGCQTEEYRFVADEAMARWRDACSFMARTMTFKTGDMVIIAPPTPLHVAPDTRLTASPVYEISNTKHHDTILDFNIK